MAKGYDNPSITWKCLNRVIDFEPDTHADGNREGTGEGYYDGDAKCERIREGNTEHNVEVFPPQTWGVFLMLNETRKRCPEKMAENG